MKNSRFTDGQIVAVLKQAEGGAPVPALCREHDISSVTFCRWLSKLGGMDASMLSRVRALEEEAWCLKKMYAGQSPVLAATCDDGRQGVLLKPAQKEMAQYGSSIGNPLTRRAPE